MATVYEHGFERRVLEVETGGSLVEAVGGLAVVVLSILGLTGIGPSFMASVSGIIFGIALLAQGAAIASEFSQLFAKVTGGTVGAFELGGGMTIEVMAGAAAVVLGILALVGQVPGILLPALIISAGGSLILTTGTLQRLSDLKMEAASAPEIAQRVARATVSGAAAAQFLAGLAAVVLGILALVSMQTAAPVTAAAPGSSMILTLVGLLVLGAAITMSGGTLARRFLQMFGNGQAS